MNPEIRLTFDWNNFIDDLRSDGRIRTVPNSLGSGSLFLEMDVTREGDLFVSLSHSNEAVVDITKETRDPYLQRLAGGRITCGSTSESMRLREYTLADVLMISDTSDDLELQNQHRLLGAYINDLFTRSLREMFKKEGLPADQQGAWETDQELSCPMPILTLEGISPKEIERRLFNLRLRAVHFGSLLDAKGTVYYNSSPQEPTPPTKIEAFRAGMAQRLRNVASRLEQKEG